MLILVLLVLGFFITGGTLGANIAGAFGLAIYGWWFVSVIVSLLALVAIVGFTAIGADIAKSVSTKTGALIGGSIGMLVAALICLYSYTMLWLSYYIVENVDQNVDNWNDLSSDIRYATIIQVALVVLFTLKNKFSSK